MGGRRDQVYGLYIRCGKTGSSHRSGEELFKLGYTWNPYARRYNDEKKSTTI